MGNPNQQNLTDPQSLNTYSYAEDNPITKEDPLGKAIAEASYSLVVNGFGFMTGIRTDQYGPELFVSSGVGAGLETGGELMMDPSGTLDHTSGTAVTVNGEASDVYGGRVSSRLTAGGSNPNPNNTSMGLVVGGGMGSSVETEYTYALPTWAAPPRKLTDYETLRSIKTTLSANSNAYNPNVTNSSSNMFSQSMLSNINPAISNSTPAFSGNNGHINSVNLSGLITSFTTPTGVVVSWKR